MAPEDSHSPSFGDWGSGPAGGAVVAAPAVAATTGSAAPSVASMRHPLARWWSRVGALLVDGLLLGLPVFGAVIVFHQYTKAYDVMSNGTIVTQYTAHNTWIESLLWLGYVLVGMCRVGTHNGQTLGKQATKVTVIRDDGNEIDARTVLVREGLGKALPGALAALSHPLLIIVLIYVVLDYLWPLWERENRALHDLLAHTHVVFAQEPVRHFEPLLPADPEAPGPDVVGP